MPAAGRRTAAPYVESVEPRAGVASTPSLQPGAGWKPKTLRPCGGHVLNRDPILHQVDVFMWDTLGDVARCKPNGTMYREAVRGARPVSAGRRKGLAEFEDLCRPSAPHWNPAHRAALQDNKKAFHRKRSELSCPASDGPSSVLTPAAGPPAARVATRRPASAGASYSAGRRPASAPRALSRERAPQSRSTAAPLAMQ
mmetsp:Transcript_28380/g.78250  ORF Transcript_28380/g.78250 Transcript_28380/m.78250 type:complete len:198 (+) Transcript_28380:331-924(+)